MTDFEQQLRIATFDWLRRVVERDGDVISRDVLAKGFEFRGEHIPLVAPVGIFKPRQCDLPLSITTSPNSPYDDGRDQNGLISYMYRGTDPDHRDNVGLRHAMLDGVPLVYFFGIVPGKYLAVWPVFIVGDDRKRLTFSVAADEYAAVDAPTSQTAEYLMPRREYITRTVRQRLHQRGFQERVMQAYREHCTICRLKHRELLDAAHIIPDSVLGGDPIVTNGLALCKIHHAAYDRGVLGISPDYTVTIREDVLVEIDGPMLKHGLVEMHGVRLLLPKSKSEWPDQERLERRFVDFRG